MTSFISVLKSFLFNPQNLSLTEFGVGSLVALVANKALPSLAEWLGERYCGNQSPSDKPYMPQTVREMGHACGAPVRWVCDKVTRLVVASKIFGDMGEMEVGTKYVCPIVEEILYRAPGVVLSNIAASHLEEKSSTLKVAQLAIMVFSSTLFTYGHSPQPQPGQGASLFTSGMISHVIADQLGLLPAMVDHCAQNRLTWKGY